LWASDGNEIYVQCVDYLHEFPIEFFVDSPMLNPKANANLLVHFFNLFIPLSLEDFDANVSPFIFDFFDDSSHGVVVTIDFID
jgi:hypothetical protein